MSRYDMEWKYIPGRLNMAGPLSRSTRTAALYLMEDVRCARRRVHLAVTTRSQQRPAEPAVPQQLPPPPPLPTQPQAAAPAAQPAPLLLTDLQRQVQQGYQEDAWFLEKENLQGLKHEDGLCYKGHQLVIPDAEELRDMIIAELHNTPYS